MTFNAIKQAIKDYCLLTSADADTRVGTAVNRHYRRITASLGLDVTRFVTRSTTTTNGVATVQFTEIEKIDRVIDATDSDAIRLLTEVSLHEIRSSQPGTGDPVRYAIQSVDADAVTIRLDTLPQSSYSLQADGWTTLSDLSANQEPVFPESFHDILVWAVIAEEMLKKEKLQLASLYAQKADELLRELRFHLADSPTKDTRQASGSSASGGGAAGGGGGSVGGTAYTQSALLTFDRGAGIVPFAVAQSDAPYVPNLGAEFLGNVTTDRLIGRDTAGTGESEQITVGGGIEFTGSGGIQRSALTGDVTASAGSAATSIALLAVTTGKINDLAVTTGKIDDLAVTTGKLAADAVTYAKIQNISATSRVLGRKTAAAGDTEECTLSEVLDFIGSAAQGDFLYRGASAWARLPAGTANYLLQTQGAGQNPAWANYTDRVSVLDRDVTVAEVVSSITNTTLYTYSVGAGVLSTNKRLRLLVIGDYLNNDGAARDFSTTITYGSTVIFNSGTLSINNAGTRRAVRMVCDLAALNSASAQVATTHLLIGGGDTIGGTNGSTDVLINNMANHVSVAEASAGALDLIVKGQHGTSSANISFRIHTVHLELVP